MDAASSRRRSWRRVVFARGEGGDERWAGGATNHEAAFAPACRVALATWALAGAAGAEAGRGSARARRRRQTFARVELGPTAAAMGAAAEATGVASKMERKGRRVRDSTRVFSSDDTRVDEREARYRGDDARKGERTGRGGSRAGGVDGRSI